MLSTKHVHQTDLQYTDLHDACTSCSPFHFQCSHSELDLTPFQTRQSAAHLLHPLGHGRSGLPQIYSLLPDLFQHKGLLSLRVLQNAQHSNVTNQQTIFCMSSKSVKQAEKCEDTAYIVK